MSLTRERFDIAREYGEDAEEALAAVLGLGRHELEVKHKGPEYDDQLLFIEMTKLSYGEWVPSGLEVTSAGWWAFVGPAMAWMFVVRTEQLRAAVARARYRGLRLTPNDKSATQETKGYLLPIDKVIEAGQRVGAIPSSSSISADGPR